MTSAPLNTLNTASFLEVSVARLNDLLARQFQPLPADFRGRVAAVAERLPEELARALAEIAETHGQLGVDPAPEPARLADFAFRCGQVYEQIEEYRRLELEMENVLTGPVSVQASPLQSGQVDQLARFVEVRDRVFRKVADFTLKALLVGLLLLTLGLALGLV